MAVRVAVVTIAVVAGNAVLVYAVADDLRCTGMNISIFVIAIVASRASLDMIAVVSVLIKVLAAAEIGAAAILVDTVALDFIHTGIDAAFAIVTVSPDGAKPGIIAVVVVLVGIVAFAKVRSVAILIHSVADDLIRPGIYVAHAVVAIISDGTVFRIVSIVTVTIHIHADTKVRSVAVLVYSVTGYLISSRIYTTLSVVAVRADRAGIRIVAVETIFINILAIAEIGAAAILVDAVAFDFLQPRMHIPVSIIAVRSGSAKNGIKAIVAVFVPVIANA